MSQKIKKVLVPVLVLTLLPASLAASAAPASAAGSNTAGSSTVSPAVVAQSGDYKPAIAYATTAAELPPIINVERYQDFTPGKQQKLLSYPSTAAGKATVLALVNPGESVTTTGKSVAGGWLEVRAGRNTGWVLKSTLLEFPESVKGYDRTDRNVRYIVGKPGTTMSSYPSDSNKIYRETKVMEASSELRTQGKAINGWTLVKVDNKEWWVKTSQILRMAEKLPSTTSYMKDMNFSVKERGADLRNYPSSSDVQGWTINTLKSGVKLTTTGRKVSNFLEVRYGNTVGWVSSSSLERASASLPKLSATLKGVNYNVKVSRSEIRSYPSSSEAQGFARSKVSTSTRLVTTGRQFEGWVEVTYSSKGDKGWITVGSLNRITAELPRTTRTDRGIQYKAKSTQKLMNFPSTNPASGWSLKTLSTGSKVETTGKKYGGWIQVKSGKTEGWVVANTFAKDMAVKNGSSKEYKLKKAVRGTLEHDGGKSISVKKGATVYTTGWTYNSKVQIKSGYNTLWIEKKLL